MKKFISTVIFTFIFFCLKAQQNIPMQKTSVTTQEKKIRKVSNKDDKGSFINNLEDSSGNVPDSVDVIVEKKSENKKVFGVFGVGNLNNEQLEKFNASGKFSCYIRPLLKKESSLTLYLSFNKSATNNDTLLASTLIFPEVGNNSFLGTAEYAFKVYSEDDDSKNHFLVPFFEFSNKGVKASRDTGSKTSVDYHFSTLNYTLGCKYLFHYKRVVDNAENDVFFSCSPYVSYLNIPDQDTADYRILLNSKTISDNLWSAGVKVAVQYNNFSIFADFRHVLGSEEKIPVRELRGFNSNIGVTFNAEIFGL